MMAKAMNVDATARRRSGRKPSRPAADHRGDERDVDRVEGGRRTDLEREPPEALVRITAQTAPAAAAPNAYTDVLKRTRTAGCRRITSTSSCVTTPTTIAGAQP